MSTLTAIPAAVPCALSTLAPANRRLAGGLLVSLLLHALLLALQFGVPGMRMGAGRPLSIVLAPPNPVQPAQSVDLPTPPAVTQPPLLPSIAVPPPVTAVPTPARTAPMPPAGQSSPPPRRGFTLRDPAPALPAPATPKPAPPARRVPRRRPRPRPQPPKEALHTEVIARQASEDPSFVLPQPEPPTVADVSDETVTPVPELPQLADEAPMVQARAEAERELAQQRAAEEENRAAEQQRVDALARQQLAERERAEELAQQQQAEQQRDRQLAERQQAEEQARQELAEQQRAQQLLAQYRTEELARQQVAEQQRAQQAAEQRRAEELARQQLAERQLAEQRRADELARQQQAEQQRAQQLAEQRQAEERAQQAAARQRAEELARRQAADAEATQRLAMQGATPGQSSVNPGGNTIQADRGAGSGIDFGSGQGAGTGSRGLPGKEFGSRARELLRGIDITKAVPPAVRAAQQAQQAVRRALADAARRDVPLRLYMDSVRQKIERNAIVSQMQLSSGKVHTDPVVSIAIRSDGSVEDVTILRSSGRPDIDDVVRRIVSLNARYSAFPPNVAANYDVIELRRIWTFAEALRLVEEVR
ncbi:TonB C-terminal domain-containing protein [Massilia sp. LXY-6]|uniref:TonB C-terminal domain-containing protein n=1 Tax=Massilia sp. LXY-6 TaxID=3379823 RepID=UPI003EDF59E9